MAGSIFGKLFRISTWGESHGKALGVVIDGCPAGLPLSEADIQPLLDRRKPGQSAFTTQRQEGDEAEILSGVFEGRTTGTPISILVKNTDQRSRDYGNLAHTYRPGHADYPFDVKYGFRDYRGGGRSSGRETLARVAGGAVAQKLLAQVGIRVRAYAQSIGPVAVDPSRFSWEACPQNPLWMPDRLAAAEAAAYLQACARKQDSVGGVVACVAEGLPVGLGEPVFDKLDARLGAALLSIGAVKGVEIGDGFAAALACGSQNNDAYLFGKNGIEKATNHAGGVLGGMSDGAPLLVRVAFKPTPSMARPQQTVTDTGEETTLSIAGRHDPIIVPRAVVVVEAMTSLVLADLLLENMTARMDSVRRFYQPM